MAGTTEFPHLVPTWTRQGIRYTLDRLKEFCVYDFAELLQVLAHCECAFRTNRPANRMGRDAVLKAIVKAGNILESLGLITSANLAVDFITQVNHDQLSDDRLSQAARNLFKTIQMESLAVICYKPYENLPFNKEFPLGQNVAEAFPDCIEDISEAHHCFLFGRYTACAFHMGRSMEIAVKMVAKEMKAKPAKQEWQPYINEMNAVIAKMPFKTPRDRAKRALFSAATDYLFNFKEAWRNPTMHPTKTHGSEQAREILSSSSSFLKHAAKHIFGYER